MSYDRNARIDTSVRGQKFVSLQQISHGDISIFSLLQTLTERENFARVLPPQLQTQVSSWKVGMYILGKVGDLMLRKCMSRQLAEKGCLETLISFHIDGFRTCRTLGKCCYFCVALLFAGNPCTADETLWQRAHAFPGAGHSNHAIAKGKPDRHPRLRNQLDVTLKGAKWFAVGLDNPLIECRTSMSSYSINHVVTMRSSSLLCPRAYTSCLKYGLTRGVRVSLSVVNERYTDTNVISPSRNSHSCMLYVQCFQLY